jgi:hypothetical protein
MRLNYRQAIGEGGSLSLGRQRNRRGETPFHGLNRLQSRATAQGLVQVESEPPGRHDRRD